MTTATVAYFAGLSVTVAGACPFWNEIVVQGIYAFAALGGEVVRQLAPNRALRSPYRAGVLCTRNFGSVAHRVVVVPVRAM